MQPLWTSSEALMATHGQARGDWQAHDLAIDSREVRPGDLFVALKGDKTDGHKFVESALKAGAVAAMVEHDEFDFRGTLPLLIVPDTLKALENLGVAARARSGAKRIGVTGSVGKTGTKEALKAALGRGARAHASIKSFNNHIGVPLTLARLPQKADYAVLEMGMNHPGELSALSDLARPDIAVITTVQPAHTEFFDSVEAIADAKAEIFHGMDAHGIAILNRDIAQFDRLADAARAQGVEAIIGFGEAEGADVRLLRYKAAEDCSCVTADIRGQIMMYKVGAPGRHWVANSLAVLAAVQAAGGDLSLAGLALASLTAMSGRGHRLRLNWLDGVITVIDESYNASPAAMAAAIEVLGDAPVPARGRHIAVLGDMLELGEQSAHFHEGLAQPLIDANVEQVFTIGPAMRGLADTLPAHMQGGHADTVESLLAMVKRALLPGDVVLVKGSNSMGLNAVVDGLKMAPMRQPGRAATAHYAL